MLLFENFKYDEEWAIKNYGDFYQSKDYIQNYLNDRDYYFAVSQYNEISSKRSKTNIYDIQLINKSNLFESPELFSWDAYDYAIEKLKELGPCVQFVKNKKFKNNHNQECAELSIMYDISLDKKRWNIAYSKLTSIIESPEMEKCVPTIDTWVYMLDNRYKNKNPKYIFSKNKDFFDTAQKYIVAIKLDWEDAFLYLENVLYGIQSLDKYAYLNKRFVNALSEFAKLYEPDEEVKDILNDFKLISKNVGEGNYVPVKYLKVANMLDENNLVQYYKFDKFFDIKLLVKCTNGNSGIIYVDESDTKGFYRLVLYINNKRQNTPINTLSYIIKYQFISAINAIYHNDFEELNKIKI